MISQYVATSGYMKRLVDAYIEIRIALNDLGYTEETAEKDLDLRREKLELLKEIDEKELKSTDTLFKRYNLQIERIDRAIQKNKELFVQQEKLLNDYVEFEKNLLKDIEGKVSEGSVINCYTTL